MDNTTVMNNGKTVSIKKNNRVDWDRVKKMKALYLLLLIPAILVFVMMYWPMYGVIIAFKDYNFADGIMGSPWNHFEHFKTIFNSIFFRRVFLNTIKISGLRILFGFPAPIIFALLLNEIGNMKFKKATQTISYLPHFMSWVVVAGFVYQILSPEIGIVNYIIQFLGGEPYYFMIKKQCFVTVLIIAQLWQSVGWSSIIYMSAITSIDPCLYESADIDGASRFRKAISITLPSITPTVTVLFILSLGHILQGGFDPIFNLYNEMVMETADVIDTYAFREGIYNSNYGYASAVGLFQNAVGLALIIVTNKIVKRINDYGIW